MTYYKTTKTPAFGHRTIGAAEDLNLDPSGGKWVTICEAHGTLMNSRTLADAKRTATLDFCETCRALVGFRVTQLAHAFCSQCDERVYDAAVTARATGSRSCQSARVDGAGTRHHALVVRVDLDPLRWG